MRPFAWFVYGPDAGRGIEEVLYGPSTDGGNRRNRSAAESDRWAAESHGRRALRGGIRLSEPGACRLRAEHDRERPYRRDRYAGRRGVSGRAGGHHVSERAETIAVSAARKPEPF